MALLCLITYVDIGVYAHVIIFLIMHFLQHYFKNIDIILANSTIAILNHVNLKQNENIKLG